MKLRKSIRNAINCLMIGLVSFWQVVPAGAAEFYWDPDATLGNDPILGTGLGGSGTWDSVSGNWFDGTSIVPWGNTTADDAIFTGPVSAPATVTVDAGGITANSLSFWRSGYVVSGGAITWAELALVSKLALVRPRPSTV